MDTSGNEIDEYPGNCVCRTLGGKCTLRAAIEEANACSGPQTIRFSGPWGITLTTALPTLTDNGTVIDGSDWWAVGSGLGLPAVWLDGNGGAFNGLEITASNCAVYGLVIKSFGGHGVYLYGGAQNNQIGGTGTHQRVVISANGQNGVRIEGTTTINNRVEGCYIGTNPEGTASPWGTTDWSNGWHGVSIWQGGSNFIRDNLIADNGWSGVAVDDAAKDDIQNNRIGVDVSGNPLGNGFYGMHIAHGAMPVVSSNTIAFNRRGIHVEGDSSPWIEDNTIYSHNASASSLSYQGCGGGILVDASSPVIAGNIITNNVAYTGTDKTGYGGGIYLFNANNAVISENLVISNAASTAGAGMGGGICIKGTASGLVVQANQVLSNAASLAHATGWGGGIAGGPDGALLQGNLIEGNRGNSVGAGEAGLYQWYGSAEYRNNLVRGNYGSYAVYLGYSRSRFEGNLVVNNSTGTGVSLIDGDSRGGPILVNNVVVRSATSNRAALKAYAYSGAPLTATLLHNTLVGEGTGYGVWVEGYVTLTLTNSLIASHTWGITVTFPASSTVSADHTLFWANVNNGFSGTNPVFGDPRFLPDGYHLGPGSAAIDAGINAGVTTDIDGDPRPIGSGYDIGADEARFLYLPLVLRNY
ncbi:MAG: right-handed parallel beta-helix repeat-containing protein [Anaerolineae bacterium]|nr:right-handed parallel beta-helix repeat-containing protein [Anaerolineae bacterium]